MKPRILCYGRIFACVRELSWIWYQRERPQRSPALTERPHRQRPASLEPGVHLPHTSACKQSQCAADSCIGLEFCPAQDLSPPFLPACTPPNPDTPVNVGPFTTSRNFISKPSLPRTRAANAIHFLQPSFFTVQNFTMCFRAREDVQAKKSREIDALIHRDEKVMQKVVKLLLLGKQFCAPTRSPIHQNIC